MILRIIIRLFLFLQAFYFFTYAQENYWTKIEIPMSGSVSSITLSNNHIFISNSTGIFRTSNLGNNWKAVGEKYSDRRAYRVKNDILVIQTSYNQCLISKDYGNTLSWLNDGQIIEPIYSIKPALNNKFIFTTTMGVYLLDTDSAKFYKTPLYGYDFINAFQDKQGNILGFTKDKLFLLKRDSLNFSQITLPYLEAYSICIDTSLSNIFLTSNLGVLKSTDFGNTWLVINSNFVKSSKCYFSENFLFLINDNWKSEKGGLLFSTDAGMTFNRRNIDADYIFSLDIDGSDILLETEKGLIYSTDYGSNWTKLNNNNPVYKPNNICADKEGNLMIFTKYGINISTDYGLTWNFKKDTASPISEDIWDCKINNKKDLLLNTGGGLFLSNFEDLKWRVLYDPKAYNFTTWVEPEFLLDDSGVIFFIIRFYIWHGGSPCEEDRSWTGYFFNKSTDRGATWLPALTTGLQDRSIKKIINLNKFKNLLLNQEGKVLCFQDGIIDDFEYPPNLLNEVVSMDRNRNGVLYILEKSGYVYFSEDNGVTWRKILSNVPVPSGLNMINAAANNDLFIRSSSKIFYSNHKYDTIQDISSGFFYGIQKLHMYGDNNAFAVCDDGLYKFNNPINYSSPSRVILIEPKQNSTFTKMNNNALMTKFEWKNNVSIDYYELLVGDSLFQKVEHYYTKLNDKSILLPVSVYINNWKVRDIKSCVRGEWSEVYRFVISKVTGTDEQKELPEKNALFQNYPNPFNPSTKIVYFIHESGFVTLKVYDILGREITTLVNDFKMAGSYEVIFDANSVNKSLASGVYFYRLQVNNFTECRRMILSR